MLLINCKVELSLTWDPNCVLCALAGNSTFTITDASLYVPIIALSTEDNAKLLKLLSELCKRRVYWDAYKVTAEKLYDADVSIREAIDSSCQRINRLFVLAYEGGDNRVTVNSHRRYFLPRVVIRNYNIEIDGRIFYDQPINNQETNDLIKWYDELRKVSTEQGDDYTTGSLLDFAYFNKNYRLIAAGLSKQKALDADSRAIQNILAPLGITAAASAIDAGIQNNIHSSRTTTLIISNEEMNDIMKIIQALKDSNVLLKGVTKTIKMKQKNKKENF